MADSLLVDDYIIHAQISYQKGEDWVTVDENTKDIPVDAHLKILIRYKDVDAANLMKHNRTLTYRIPELFTKVSVVVNTIQDAENNKIGDITVDQETKKINLTFWEAFLKADEEENSDAVTVAH